MQLYIAKEYIKNNIPTTILEDTKNNEDFYSYKVIYLLESFIKEYELDEFQSIILMLNYDDIFKLYGYYKPTLNDKISIKKDKMGITFTHAINEEGIKRIKQLFNNNNRHKLNIINLSSIHNNPIFYMDIKSILKNNTNLTLDELIDLSLYCNDQKLIEQYISILNKCNKETKDLILEFLKPLTFDKNILDNIFKDTNLPTFIFNKNILNKDNFTEEYTNYLIKMQYTSTRELFNLLFIKCFNNIFKNKIKLIKNILKKDNINSLLEQLILIKNKAIELNPNVNITIRQEAKFETRCYTVYDGDCYGNDRECAIYDSHDEYETVFYGYDYIIENLELHEEEIKRIVTSFNLILPMIVSDKYDYQKIFESNCSNYVNHLLSSVKKEEKEKCRSRK